MNNAINPSPLTLELMHARSRRVTKVSPMPKTKGIGGLTNTVTGEVRVPLGNSAFERLIRFHEGLHSQHTQPWKSKDLLDQALEDARLHRYCSTSRSSAFTQARRDELTIALRDLRGIRRAAKRGIPLNVTASVVIVRSAAILAGNPKYDAPEASHNFVRECCNLLGCDAYKRILAAIRVLEGAEGVLSKQWKTAREYLIPYFRADYSSDMSSTGMSSTRESESGAKSSESNGEGKAKSDEESKPEDSEDSDDEGESEDEGESKESVNSASVSEGKSEGKSKGEPVSTSPSKGSKSSKDEGMKIEMAPIPKARKTALVHPLAYKDDLTPEIDAKTYSKMQSRYPLELRIRRLEMAGNRVPCTIGQRRPAPVTGGSRIITSRLASAMTNPSVRVFRRPYAKGNAGTILIDASGSMYIPEKMLQKFCAEAPALTLAFYNAPSDDYGTYRLGTTHGNLYVYAANGFRAQKLPDDFRWNPSYDWGGGNMIDYQATAWLLKQPGPRYLITDIMTTGPWEYPARNLILKAWRSKLITVLPDLECMRDILFKTHDPAVKETIDDFQKEWVE